VPLHDTGTLAGSAARDDPSVALGRASAWGTQARGG